MHWLKPMWNFILIILYTDTVTSENNSSCCTSDQFYLDCHECSLEYIPQNIDRSIILLNLRKNDIEKLAQSQFGELHQLQELILSYNPLQTVHPNAFKGLSNLKSLDLSFIHTEAAWSSVNFSFVYKIKNFYFGAVNINDSYYTESLQNALSYLRNIKKIMISATYDLNYNLPGEMYFLHKLDYLIICYLNVRLYHFSFVAVHDKITSLMLRLIFIESFQGQPFSHLKKLKILILSRLVNFPLNITLTMSTEHLEALIYHHIHILHLEDFVTIQLHSQAFNYLKTLVVNFYHNKGTKFPNGIFRAPFFSLKYLAIEIEDWKELYDCFTDIDLKELVNTTLSTALRYLVIRCHSHVTPHFNDWEMRDLVAESFMVKFPNVIIPRCYYTIFNQILFPVKPGLRLSTIATRTCISYLVVHLDFLDNTTFFDSSGDAIAPLTFLNLSGTPLGSITKNQGLYFLQYLDLTNCSLHELDPKFIENTNLRYLSLSHNFVAETFFTASPFRKLQNLHQLYMDNVSLSSSINLELFANLGQLKKLSLKHNKLTAFKFNITKLFTLEILDLGHNKISQFDFNISHMKHLKQIDLSYNDIRTFHAAQVKEIQNLSANHSLAVMDLTGNLLTCSCFSLDFLRWLTNTTIALKNFSSYNCYSVFHDKNVFIAELNMLELVKYCEETRRQTENTMDYDDIIVISVTLSALIIGIFVVYKLRWKLRWRFYKMQRTLRTKVLLGPKINSETSLTNLTSRYDAFVSYNHDKDFDWVRHSLMPKVEEDWGLKLCVGQRDFLAGAAIAENIVNAVENSHRTLIILTPDFLTSQWCDFELHMALTRGHQHVIICYIRNVDQMKLKKTMRRLIKRLTYIEYAEDNDGKELFWAKLKECLLLKKPDLL